MAITATVPTTSKPPITQPVTTGQDALIVSEPLSASDAGNLSAMSGSAKIVLAGSAVTTIGTAMLPIVPWGTVVGGIVAACGLLISLAGKLFGNKFHTSSNVRWLIQWFQYYVEGNGNVTSARNINEHKLNDCYQWFTAVLGVPIYDNLRVHTLKGTDQNTGKVIEPKKSYHIRAIEYLNYWDAKEANVSYNNAYAAAQIADLLIEDKKPGSWADLPFAPYWFTKISKKELGEFQDQNNLVNALETAEAFKDQANTSAAEYEEYSKGKNYIIIGSIIVLLILALIIFRKRIFK